MIACEEYGYALYMLASEAGIADGVHQTLMDIDSLFSRAPEYQKLLDTPAVPTEEKLGLIDRTFGECEQIVINFLKILCEKHSVYYLHACVNSYHKFYNEAHGITEAVCVTAVPLTEEQRAALQQNLCRDAGKVVVITEQVDSSLIGGMIVHVDGKQFDGSIRTRIDDFRHSFEEIIV